MSPDVLRETQPAPLEVRRALTVDDVPGSRIPLAAALLGVLAFAALAIARWWPA